MGAWNGCVGGEHWMETKMCANFEVLKGPEEWTISRKGSGEKGRGNDSAERMEETFMTFYRVLCLGSCSTPNARGEIPVADMIGVSLCFLVFTFISHSQI